MSEPDNDPRRLEIMTDWVRRIVDDVVKHLADDIVDRVGQVFLQAKTSNTEMARINRLRFEALETAIADLRARIR